MVKALTRAFSRLKALTGTFTFKTLIRHYAKRVLTHGKLMQNWEANAIIIRDRQQCLKCESASDCENTADG